MPVGTSGAVKGIDCERLRETGTQMVLANTYHLALRPGADLVAAMGGLHAWMGWDGPILTDSGGFQVFSLADRSRITEEGVEFRSHIDGAKILLTPEKSVRIQEQLGSDIAMVLDQVIALPAERAAVQEAMERSIRWAIRCQAVASRSDQALFGIVQGGLESDFRRQSATALVALEFKGYAIGGLSVGESPEAMIRVLEETIPQLPENQPRYLMGVGRPEDLLEGVRRGIDLFDCVMPTRNGRNALAFTDHGPLRLRNRRHALDPRPLDTNCRCLACRHSRSYLRHLFQTGEMLGPILLSIHNLTYYHRLLTKARQAIANNQFEAFCRKQYAGWNEGPPSEEIA